MLILSRYADERIRIGDDVIVTVVEIRGDKVRLGVDAPREVPVHREEIFQKLAAENRKENEDEGES